MDIGHILRRRAAELSKRAFLLFPIQLQEEARQTEEDWVRRNQTGLTFPARNFGARLLMENWVTWVDSGSCEWWGSLEKTHHRWSHSHKSNEQTNKQTRIHTYVQGPGQKKLPSCIILPNLQQLLDISNSIKLSKSENKTNEKHQTTKTITD